MQTRVCFSPSAPYSSGLVLRTTLCSDTGMFSGSLNLQTCTLLGNLWCLKDILTEWQELGTAEGLGSQKQGGDLQSRTLAGHPWEHQESLLVPISEQTLLLLPLTQSQGKGANLCKRAELQLLTGGQIWLFCVLNPDLHNQFLASPLQASCITTIY